jgi:hypothetical protein
VTLHRAGEQRTFDVHRLVAQAFVASTQQNQQTNHKDGDKTNNRADNLEWVSGSENQRHAVALGLLHPPILRGEDSGSAKLTAQQVREIRALTGVHSQRKIGHKYGISHNHVGRIQHGVVWRHV